MNVVFLPALAGVSLPALSDGLPCVQGPCLLGWAWAMLALTFASMWAARRWQAGSNDDVATRFIPAAASATGSALLPVLSNVAPSSLTASPDAAAGLRPGVVLADVFGLRAPPTTDMVGQPARDVPRAREAGPSSPSREPRPSRSTGTPTGVDVVSTLPGQLPPA